MNERSAGAASAMWSAVDEALQPGRSPWHHHDEHELLWSADGSFRVEVGIRSWLIGPGTGVWVPAGVEHRTVATQPVDCGYVLVDADVCPPMWNQVAALPVGPLLRHLLLHLRDDLVDRERAHAEVVVLDLLQRVLSMSLVELPMPRDPRCRAVAEAILDDPATTWELADWAEEVGTSARTLARRFQAETCLSFGQWRTQARIRVAIAALTAGRPVGAVARQVGYASASAFVTAFRKATGRTPSEYAADDGGRRAAVPLSVAG